MSVFFFFIRRYVGAPSVPSYITDLGRFPGVFRPPLPPPPPSSGDCNSNSKFSELATDGKEEEPDEEEFDIDEDSD